MKIENGETQNEVKKEIKKEPEIKERKIKNEIRNNVKKIIEDRKCNSEEDKNITEEAKNNIGEIKTVRKDTKNIKEIENAGTNEITKSAAIPEICKPIVALPVAQTIPEPDSIPFEKLPLRDPELFKEGIEKSPLASFFQSPMNIATSKCHYGSPQAQSGMILPLSGMGNSCFNQFTGSPSFGAHMDFSSFMNPSPYQNGGNPNFPNSAFSPDNFSPCFFTSNAAQGVDSFCKAEEKDN